jgi:uncharacterized protein (TIGR02145 family)
LYGQTDISEYDINGFCPFSATYNKNINLASGLFGSGMTAIDDVTLVSSIGTNIVEVDVSTTTAGITVKFPMPTNRDISGDLIYTTSNQLVCSYVDNITSNTYITIHDYSTGAILVDINISSITYPWGLYIDAGVIQVCDNNGQIFSLDLDTEVLTLVANVGQSLNGASQAPECAILNPITTTTTTTVEPTTTTTIAPTTTTTTTVDPCLDCVAHDLTIGTQTWTGCNLDVTTFRNGDPIPEVTDPSAWIGLTTPAWCYYNNDSVNGPTYGKLYNWYAVNDPRGLAPVGYHIPSDTEWTTLTTFLGGSTVAGGALKQQGFCHWLTQNTATNSSGFSGLPGGYRGTGGGFFGSLGTYGSFWSTSQYDPTASYFLSLFVADNTATIQVANNIDGQSVRLIKD